MDSLVASVNYRIGSQMGDEPLNTPAGDYLD